MKKQNLRVAVSKDPILFASDAGPVPFHVPCCDWWVCLTTLLREDLTLEATGWSKNCWFWGKNITDTRCWRESRQELWSWVALGLSPSCACVTLGMVLTLFHLWKGNQTTCLNGVALQIKWHNAAKAFRECMFRKWQCYDYTLPTSKFLGSQLIGSQRQTTFAKPWKNSPVHRATLGAPCLEFLRNLLIEQIQVTLPNTDFNEWLALGMTSGPSPHFSS